MEVWGVEKEKKSGRNEVCLRVFFFCCCILLWGVEEEEVEDGGGWVY